MSHIPGATSLCSATPFLVPAPSFLAQLPPVTGPGSSVAAQTLHRPEQTCLERCGNSKDRRASNWRCTLLWVPPASPKGALSVWSAVLCLGLANYWSPPPCDQDPHKGPAHACPASLAQGGRGALPPALTLVISCSPLSPGSPSAKHSSPCEDSHSQLQTEQFSSWVTLLALNFKYFSPNKEQSFPNYEAEVVRGLTWEQSQSSWLQRCGVQAHIRYWPPRRECAPCCHMVGRPAPLLVS